MNKTTTYGVNKKFTAIKNKPMQSKAKVSKNKPTSIKDKPMQSNAKISKNKPTAIKDKPMQSNAKISKNKPTSIKDKPMQSKAKSNTSKPKQKQSKANVNRKSKPVASHFDKNNTVFRFEKLTKELINKNELQENKLQKIFENKLKQTEKQNENNIKSLIQLIEKKFKAEPDPQEAVKAVIPATAKHVIKKQSLTEEQKNRKKFNIYVKNRKKLLLETFLQQNIYIPFNLAKVEEEPEYYKFAGPKEIGGSTYRQLYNLWEIILKSENNKALVSRYTKATSFIYRQDILTAFKETRNLVANVEQQTNKINSLTAIDFNVNTDSVLKTPIALHPDKPINV